MNFHGAPLGPNINPVMKSPFYKGFYGRMFRDLKPWNPRSIAQANDQTVKEYFRKKIVPQMVDNNTSDNNRNIPAGYTYFGQFIDHDITFDPSSIMVRMRDPQRIRNFRTPRLDLDCIYGGGPQRSPHLYEKSFGEFIIGNGINKKERDLPRIQIRRSLEKSSAKTKPSPKSTRTLGRAIIADPRNDDHLIISQFQLAFMMLHNKILKGIPKSIRNPKHRYQEARRIVIWFYQYIVWNDFVKRIIRKETWKSVLKKETKGFVERWALNNNFYDWRNHPFIPVEFSAAAFRFGHSLVRDEYMLNQISSKKKIITMFSDSGLNDLRGGFYLPKGSSLQWNLFLKFPDSEGEDPQPARLIDPFISKSINRLPPKKGKTLSLAFLDLRRGWKMGLPSGPDVARHMGIKPLKTEEYEEPLWVYILKEAKYYNDGLRLSKVGSTIVGEVFAGLLIGDPNSYLHLSPNWTPKDEPLLQLNRPASNARWGLSDLISLAGMPITAQDVKNLVQ